jgi:hypothetical protein
MTKRPATWKPLTVVTKLFEHLENAGHLTEYDYEFLAGNVKLWDAISAAYNHVSEWCQNKGYGTFGKPTERGKAAMALYEKKNNAG